MEDRGPVPRGNPGYDLYEGDGRTIGYREMLDRCVRADIVLFGEIHEHAVVHRLELQLARDLAEIKKGDLMLGAEMLEADNQLQL